MSISIAKYSEMQDKLRYDAEYYKKEYLDTERQLEENKECILLEGVSKKSKRRFNPLSNLKDEFNYIEIEGIDLSSGKYTFSTLKNYEAPSRARKLLDYKDVLISTVRPNRNAVAIFLEKGDEFVCSTGFAIIKCQKINPFYLFLFLKTRFAVNQLVRKTSAAMYPAVSEDDIMKLKVILPNEKSQKEIETIINLAHNKEMEAENKFKEAETKLYNLLKIKTLKFSDKKTNVISFSKYKNTLRLDSRFYLQKYEDALEALNNSGFEIKTVSEIIADSLKSGSTPLAGSNAYIGKERGVPFYRIVDLKDFELSENDLLYVRKDIHNSTLKRSKLKSDDVLFSIAGTIGICVVVPRDFKEGNINQALAIIRLRKNYSPYFVALYFNSHIGKLISEKISRPVVQANLNLTELATLPVPNIPINFQSQITALVISAIRLRQEARTLIKDAIFKIEKIV